MRVRTRFRRTVGLNADPDETAPLRLQHAAQVRASPPRGSDACACSPETGGESD